MIAHTIPGVNLSELMANRVTPTATPPPMAEEYSPLYIAMPPIPRTPAPSTATRAS